MALSLGIFVVLLCVGVPDGNSARAARTVTASAPSAGVVIIGDSLTVGSRGRLTQGLAQAGIASTIDAAVGRHTSAGYAEPLSGVRALRRVLETTRPSLVVAALGTNDVAPGVGQTTIRRDVEAFVAAAGGVRVCWMAIHRRGSDDLAQAFERANGWYRAAVESLGGCWLTWTPDPGEWASEGVHLTAAGYQRRADQLVEQIGAELDADPPEPSPVAADLGSPVGIGDLVAHRVFDSRDGSGRPTLAAATDRRVPIAAVVGPGTSAVAVELTMTGAVAAGWMSVWGCGTWPGTSTVNVGSGATRANLALVLVDPADPALCVRSSVASDVVIDLLASLRPQGTPLAVGTGRLFDSRPGTVAAGRPVRIAVPDPAATAAVVTLTSLGGGAGYASAGGCERAPEVSNLNFDGPDPVAGTTLVAVTDGGFCVWPSTTIGLLVDVSAVVSPAGDSLIQPTGPTRVVDTRRSLGATTVGPAAPIRLDRIIANVTAPGTGQAGYFSPSCTGTTSIVNVGASTTAVADLAVVTDCLTASTRADVVVDQIARLVAVPPQS